MEAETERNDTITKRDQQILGATTAIVCSAIASGRWEPGQIAGLVPEIHNAIKAALDGAEAPAVAVASTAFDPAPEPVEKPTQEQIAASIQPDHLVSFEDGKHYKTLKRNLSARGLSPEQYRANWGLPKDYPMVAPNYAAQRSALAKSIGLGRRDQPEAELPR